MVAGFTYLVAQLALLLAAALIVGVLIGGFVWPGGGLLRGRRQTDTSADTEQRIRLAAAEATIQELRTTISRTAEQKESELGWLETRAIQAMDSLVVSHEERVLALQAQLAAAAAEARNQERELEAERRHTLRLQAALVARDERINELIEELAERDRRLSLKSVPGSSPRRG